MSNSIIEIPVGLIDENPENPRRKINPDELAELAESIKSVGLLQPITVRLQKGRAGRYQMVCGHRRHLACKAAGLETVLCIVRELTDEQAYDLMITENLQRKDIDPFEESDAFCAMRAKGYDTESLAAKFGKSKTYILSRLKLESLIKEFRDLYEKGEVEFSHCNVIARCDIHTQARLYGDHYTKTGWQDLRGKSISDVKNSITGYVRDLRQAIFDTGDCSDCPHNTATWDIFPDGCGKCDNADCFKKKQLAAQVAIFDRVREHNPDFFIFDDFGIPRAGDENAALLDVLKAKGYPLKKGDDANAYEGVELNGGKWQIDPEQTVTGYSFGWKGWCGVRRKVCENKPQPYKNDWQLDRMADREEKMKEIREDIIRENIREGLPAMAEKMDYPRETTILNYVLEILWNNVSDEISVGGLDSQMDAGEAHKKIATGMRGVDKWAALLGWAMAYDDDGRDVSVEPFRDFLPSAFGVAENEAKRRFYDEAREYWLDWPEDVTDEMIDADLEERRNKSKSKGI